MSEPRVCRCGHYETLHLSSRYACALYWDRSRNGADPSRADLNRCHCRRFRPARWTDEHSPWRHVAVRLWWSLPASAAWWVIDHWPIPGRCWCDLVDSVMPIAYPERREDHSCPCDVPLPIDAGKPSPGRCYCPPIGETP